MQRFAALWDRMEMKVTVVLRFVPVIGLVIPLCGELAIVGCETGELGTVIDVLILDLDPTLVRIRHGRCVWFWVVSSINQLFEV